MSCFDLYSRTAATYGRWPATASVLSGAERDRTDDLRHAKPALSQLSYSPVLDRFDWTSRSWVIAMPDSVGRGRLELPTSRLSGVRSNHLSYRPEGDTHVVSS